jgi:hypothetical protein
MKRATLEFNYEKVWKEIFGSYARKVDVLEALKCFKCDTQGLMLICRIRLKGNNMTIKQLLQGNGLLTNIELLYKEKDDSLVVFVEGKPCVSSPPKNAQFKVIPSYPPEFLDIDNDNNRIVGVHILSDMAADMIQEGVMAVKYGLNIDDIIDTVHVFPMMTEATKLIATAFKQDIGELTCCAE